MTYLISTLFSGRRASKFGALGYALGLGLLLAAGSACGPKYPNCEADGDCKEAEFCVNGLCQQCRSDSDCAAGQSCNAGRCETVEGYCESNSDCPDGEECLNNMCTVAVSQNETLPPPEEGGDTGCELQTVFFGYDSDNLEASARSTLQANARCLKDRGLAQFRVTGHADPRGTEEYNMALGDRRAAAVAKYLQTLGLQKKSILTSSAGEEMASGTDESSWARDRKVDFSAAY